MAMALVGCTSAGENKTSENVVSSDVVNEADGNGTDANGTSIEVIGLESDEVLEDDKETGEDADATENAEMSAEEQIEVFANNSEKWLTEDALYVAVSDLNMDGKLELSVIYDNYTKPVSIYRTLGNNIGETNSLKRGETLVTPGNSKDFIERINCYKMNGQEYYFRLVKNFDWGGVINNIGTYSMDEMNIASDSDGYYLYPFVDESGSATVLIKDEEYKWTDASAYDNWEKSIIADYEAVDTYELGWKQISFDSWNNDSLYKSYEDFKKVDGKFSGVDERLAGLFGDSVQFVTSVDAASNRALYAIAEYGSDFKEGEAFDVASFDHSFLYSLIWYIGEDALTDAIEEKYQDGSTPIGSLYRIDRAAFEAYLTDVLGVGNLETIYASMDNAWEMCEIGAFYDANDGYVYGYIGTIGYYTDSICVLNDVYNDGYMGTFLVYDDLSDRFTKMAKIYYVPANNNYGYVVKSVEIKGNSFDN